MDNILPNTDFTEFENRVYLNPQVGLDESNTFIDNLRSTQGQQNQQIFTDTQRLGTNVPTDIGGLTGANSYFTSRYQTPQTNANIANLRATAQAAALNQVLANEQEMWKKRYQDAYRDYQKRSWNKAYSGGGSYGGGNEEGEETGFESTDVAVGRAEPQFSSAGSGNYTFTPNTFVGVPSFGDNNDFNVGGSLIPSGTVNIIRNEGGGIESLTYDGKTYTGDAAKTRFDFLIQNGSLSKVEE